MLRTAAYVVALMIAGSIGSCAQAEDCPSVTNLSQAELLQWIDGHRDRSEGLCLAIAINRIGEFRSVEATSTLLDFLDFQRPETDREKLHISTLHDKFPAVPALFSIGKPAVPQILERLKTGNLSENARHNAVRSLVLIYRDNPVDAVTALRKAADKLGNDVEKDRILVSARDAASTCPKSWQSRCSAALTTDLLQ